MAKRQQGKPKTAARQEDIMHEVQVTPDLDEGPDGILARIERKAQSHLLRDPGSSRHRLNATPPKRPCFRRSPTPSRTFIQVRHNCGIFLLNPCHDLRVRHGRKQLRNRSHRSMSISVSYY